VAALVLILATLSATLAGVLMHGPESGVHFGFLAEALVAFLIFHHRRQWLAFLFAFVAGTMYVASAISGLNVAHATAVAEGSMFRSTTTQIVIIIFVLGFFARRLTGNTQAKIREEREAYRDLMYSLYPKIISEDLLSGRKVRPRKHELVSVICCDIVGFTALSEERSPEATVELLDKLFTSFDRLCEMYGFEKVKTIGDGYLAAGGLWDNLPTPENLLSLTRGMVEEASKLAESRCIDIFVRVGVGSGSVYSGVVGSYKASFDLWGATVARAYIMERSAKPGTVLVDEETARIISALENPVELRDETGQVVCAFSPPPGASNSEPNVSSGS